MKDFIKKKHIYQIILIVATSVLLAFVYNALNPKGLPLIYKPVKVEKISDTELFSSPAKPAAIVISKPKDTLETKVKVIAPIQDTAKKAKVANEESNLSKTITYNQMLKIIADPNFIIIDARNTEDFAEAHIGKAINIFPYDQQDIIFAKAQKLPTDKKIVVYCDGGNCDSSHKLAEFLDMLGFNNVYIYTGGWEDWSKHKGIK